MSVSLPILASKALASPNPHRIDNAVSPRQNELYKLRYIETLHVDVSLSSVCCGSGICEILDAQRQTFENVFLIYKAARSPTEGLTSDTAKIGKYFQTKKESARYFQGIAR